ncbi:uncharacterized protein LOC120489360 isoform X3 [Pimephales promelas]|uniref:uncharacterized protein LOC120489360 isoform X3 n=1 Tax=Pimephales promelas TaxID=90988 RepID=UPI001955B7F4|nr:uncharacterized protein LOC120489360 isoform X3 [Pimephales promelas]XP_039542043.1 uncharacterized protein LOC120489360 isoform X3 [Pimephales promelas]XP_039542044.1 uncharacterized protein LOC120489360 isoform X3 [Pimephales promelas]
MAFIKEESEDMKVEETFSEDIKILETFSMKQEETEEQTKMAFIKEESEDMQIEETFSVKQEETEKQTAETRRNAYDAAFKLKAIDLAAEKGNRAAARELGLNESMIRRWKQQREELTQCKKTTKAFRGNKSRWPELENELEDWVNTQRAGGRGVSTVQIRLKAKRIATAMKLEDFSGGPSWCLRFMRRKGLSIRVRTSLCQQLPPDYEEKVSNFHKFTDAKIAAHSIGLHNIINMDEVPLTFDLPLTRTVNRKGESSVTLKTNGHEKTHFTCVLSCTASGEKLPPMVIFKRTTMPKENFPIGIVVKVNKEGWMTESLMHEWHTECYGKRPGGLFHRNKALLVLDSMRAHITDSVKEAIKRSNSIPAVIPGGTTKYLHPLDINVNRAFKVALRVQWEAWMTRREKSFTKTGRIRRATYGQVCQWVLTAWNNVKKSTIINGFRKAGLLRVEEGSVGDLPPDESDESDNENDPISDEAILRRFNSDTEGEDFDGFSAQEEEDRKTNYFLAETRRNAYDAAFKLKAIDLAAEKGNRAAARELGLNESMIRRWKQQREDLTQCKKTTKAFRGNKSRWPELENELEDWVNTQRADGRGVSTVQIRLKAKRIATAMKLEDFRGGPSWCLRFMRRKGLSIRVRTSLCQQLPPDYEEKVSNFHKFTDAKIAAHSICPQDIINMDEVPLTFDLPLTRTVSRKGESSVTLKTNGHEKTHFTCVLSCTASGEKLPPMVIFKRTTMPKENFPIGIVVKANKEGWMTESLMHEWHTECYGKRPGGLFHRNKALLVLDSMRAHITDSVKEAIKRSNSIPAVIPGGTTKYLHPLDISVNRAFKVALRVQWEAWMTRGEKSFTKTGRIRRATYGQVCQWVLTAWNNVKKSTIINAFRKAGLLRVEEGSAGDLPPDESDESDNENNPTSDEAILRLFNSDTEGEDFDGFSAQEEEDSDQ